ncbi:MAG: large repetitive protein [Candidatus Sumerlaeota bacterium]|nr:large repetitive protein [Candidatus Sumerlaeota bacterium]
MKTLVRFSLFAVLAAGTIACTPKAYAPAPLPEVRNDGVAPFLHDAGYYGGAELHLTREIAPGVTHAFDSFAKEPLTINTITFGPLGGDLVLEAEKGLDGMNKRERIPDMVARLYDPASRPIVAINGDFWGGGSVPIGPFVDEDMIWKSPWRGGGEGTRSCFAWSQYGGTFIGQPKWTMAVLDMQSGASLPIDQVNFPIAGLPVTAYTWPIGDKAPERAEAEQRIGVKLDSPRWLPNERAMGTVVAVGEDAALEKDLVILGVAGDVAVPAWLSVPGTRVALDARLEGVSRNALVDAASDPVIGVVGGGPRLLRDGEVVVEEEAPKESIRDSFVTDLHPRTAVGVRADGSIVMCVVDGRQPGKSQGINLMDLAEWMKKQGCVDAMNLDGGGSSTMSVRGELVNFPSDAGGSRSVSNGIVLRRTAPVGAPARLEIQPAKTLAVPDAAVPLTAQAYDAAHEPVDISDWTMQWSADAGSVAGEGIIATPDQTGTVTVEARARRGNVLFGSTIQGTATIEVVEPAVLEFVPDAVLLQPGESVEITLRAKTADGKLLRGENLLRELGVPAFLSYEAGTQTIVAESDGVGFVTAALGGLKARLPVAVGHAGETVVQSFDSLPAGDPDAWLEVLRAKPEKTGLALESTTIKEGSAAWRFSYGMASGGTTKVALPVDVELPGKPLAIGFWLYGDGQGQWVRGDLRDAIGNRYYVDFTDSAHGVDWKDEWRLVRASLVKPASAGTPKGPLTYPLSLYAIYVVQPQEAAKRDGEFLIDALTAYGLPEGME